ncbi:MAG: YggS family pyridoxal phosphate-dependent enzyme [Verrucomicrobiota bacterium]
MVRSIAANLEDIRARMESACRRAGRNPQEVELLAVSKTVPLAAIAEAAVAGQRIFAESRLQELEAKLPDCPPRLEWHFIGSVQRNKVRKIIEHCAVVHAVDSVRLATYINGVAAEEDLQPRIFLQINVGNEASKGGFAVAAIESALEAIAGLSHLAVAGLMCIPPEEKSAEAARLWFSKLRNMRDHLEHSTGMKLPGLSMGMSGDFEVAIEEGATHVRVGSAIFGGRTYQVDAG